MYHCIISYNFSGESEPFFKKNHKISQDFRDPPSEILYTTAETM